MDTLVHKLWVAQLDAGWRVRRSRGPTASQARRIACVVRVAPRCAQVGLQPLRPLCHGISAPPGSPSHSGSSRRSPRSPRPEIRRPRAARLKRQRRRGAMSGKSGGLGWPSVAARLAHHGGSAHGGRHRVVAQGLRAAGRRRDSAQGGRKGSAQRASAQGVGAGRVAQSRHGGSPQRYRRRPPAQRASIYPMCCRPPGPLSWEHTDRCVTCSGRVGELPYRIWGIEAAGTGDTTVALPQDVAAGRHTPLALTKSRTVYIPKGAYQEDTARPARSATQMRPIKLMQIAAKLLVVAVSRDKSKYVTRTACGHKRGFIPGRRILDNIVEIEGALYEHSMGAHTFAGGLLLDFADSFPSIPQCWASCVVCLMHTPIEPFNITHALCISLIATIPFNSHGVASVNITLGIQQGCPLSGTLLALGLDQVLR